MKMGRETCALSYWRLFEKAGVLAMDTSPLLVEKDGKFGLDLFFMLNFEEHPDLSTPHISNILEKHCVG